MNMCQLPLKHPHVTPPAHVLPAVFERLSYGTRLERAAGVNVPFIGSLKCDVT